MNGRQVLALGSIIILVALLFVLLSSCESDDEYYHVPTHVTTTKVEKSKSEKGSKTNTKRKTYPGFSSPKKRK